MNILNKILISRKTIILSAVAAVLTCGSVLYDYVFRIKEYNLQDYIKNYYVCVSIHIIMLIFFIAPPFLFGYKFIKKIRENRTTKTEFAFLGWGGMFINFCIGIFFLMIYYFIGVVIIVLNLIRGVVSIIAAIIISNKIKKYLNKSKESKILSDLINFKDKANLLYENRLINAKLVGQLDAEVFLFDKRRTNVFTNDTVYQQ